MLANRPQIRSLCSIRDIVHRVVDAALILASLVLVAKATAGLLTDHHWMAGGVIVIFYSLTAEAVGTYRNWRGVSGEREIVSVFSAWVLAWLLALAFGFAVGYSNPFTASALWLWFFTVPVLIISSRLLTHRVMQSLRARGMNTRNYAIVGVNKLGFQLAENIEASPELGLKFLGFYDDRPSERLPDIPEKMGHSLGNFDELVEHARARRVDMIYVTLPMRAESRIRDILERLSDTTASVYIVPDFFVFELLHSRWTNVNGLPVVSIFENPFYGIDGLVKRALDFVVANLLLLLLALPMAIIALGIKLTSRGPVFFRQRRYGLDGREILVWKFRSMKVCEDGDHVPQATKNDPRVTRLGAILRKTSLDELPQLFNVIQGNMSLIGPRPHPSSHNELYRKQIGGYMLRHKVKPGITGLAQVNGWRGETDTIEKMEGRIACDHQYIREWSLWMDIKILFKTVFVVLSRDNAY